MKPPNLNGLSLALPTVASLLGLLMCAFAD
jgi:hypothetical protein